MTGEIIWGRTDEAAKYWQTHIEVLKRGAPKKNTVMTLSYIPESEAPTQTATGTFGNGNKVAPPTFLDKLRAFSLDHIEGKPPTDADHSEAFCGLLKHVEGLIPPPPDFDLNQYKRGV